MPAADSIRLTITVFEPNWTGHLLVYALAQAIHLQEHQAADLWAVPGAFNPNKQQSNFPEDNWVFALLMAPCEH